MKVSAAAFAALVFSAAATEASAATFVTYADPMTFQRHTVVIDSKGPDRAFFCMLPPAESGCVEVPVKRVRR